MTSSKMLGGYLQGPTAVEFAIVVAVVEAAAVVEKMAAVVPVWTRQNGNSGTYCCCFSLLIQSLP